MITYIPHKRCKQFIPLDDGQTVLYRRGIYPLWCHYCRELLPPQEHIAKVEGV